MTSKTEGFLKDKSEFLGNWESRLKTWQVVDEQGIEKHWEATYESHGIDRDTAHALITEGYFTVKSVVTEYKITAKGLELYRQRRRDDEIRSLEARLHYLKAQKMGLHGVSDSEVISVHHMWDEHGKERGDE